MKAIRLLTLVAVALALAPSASAQQREFVLVPAPTAPTAPAHMKQVPQQSSNSLVSEGEKTAAGNPLDSMGVRKYLLGPGDVLDLRVFNEPQFSGLLHVTDEGFVDVPFVGPVAARCRSDVEVKKDIVAALSKYLKNPQVSLRITEARSRPPAVVFGAVREPARVDMKRSVHLLDLLAISGGVTEQAGGDIQVFHTEAEMCPDPAAPQVAAAQPAAESLTGAFTVYRLADLKLGKREANPVIRPGDIVIVSQAPPVYLTGAVNNPQGVYLRERLQLTRAIAMVGGTKKGAKLSEVTIHHINPDTGEDKIEVVNFDAIKKQKQPDVLLQPYDVVEVPEQSGLKVDIMNFIRGGALQAATTAVTGVPLRVLY